MCLHCGTSMPELEPRMFSFNSPHGACPRCTGLGSQMEIDPELIVPDPSLSLERRGDPALVHERLELLRADDAGDRGQVGGRHATRPGRTSPRSVRDCFLYGTNGDRIYVSYRNRYGRRRSYMTTFEGIVPNLERRYRETDSDWSREKIEEYMTLRPCPECNGARLRPESLAVTVGGLGIHEFTRMSARRAIEWLERAGAVRHRAPDRAADPARDRRAAALPRQRRRRLPVARARGGHAVGRRGAADPAGHPDRLVARGRALHPRRAVDRPAPARQRAPDRHARAAARPRQHRDRGRARRGHDARGRPPRGPRARAPASTAGELVAEGTPERGHARRRSRSPASSCRASARSRCRRSAAGPRGYIEIEGASQHNLKNIDVKVPLGRVLLRSPACRARASRRS